jgi:hypothetical protein
MDDILLDLGSPATWPDDLLAYLDSQHALFLAWEIGTGEVSGQAFDAAIEGLEDRVDRYSIVGWHCTRLTDEEIAAIIEGGMQLPNGTMLKVRLDGLTAAGRLTETIADKLKATNQADDDNRAGRVWFCFYPPRLAGEGGIERFFRHWGGEALYNSHEDDPETGPSIASIGRPCLVEAVVPISGMDSTRVAFNVARRYLIHRGFETEEPVELEASVKQPLPASSIRRIIVFPEPDFISLTECDTWDKPIPSLLPN